MKRTVSPRTVLQNLPVRATRLAELPELSGEHMRRVSGGLFGIPKPCPTKTAPDEDGICEVYTAQQTWMFVPDA